MIIHCTKCNARLRISQAKPGAQVACPRCKTLLDVPEPESQVDKALIHFVDHDPQWLQRREGAEDEAGSALSLSKDSATATATRKAARSLTREPAEVRPSHPRTPVEAAAVVEPPERAKRVEGSTPATGRLQNRFGRVRKAVDRRASRWEILGPVLGVALTVGFFVLIFLLSM